jgi:uncharacterized membrane protein YgcG
MADLPATSTFPFRRALFWLAWLLLLASLLLPAPASLAAFGTIGGSAHYVFVLANGWSVATPGTAGSLRFGQAALLGLALYSNVVFIIMPYMLRVTSVSVTTKAFLLVALALDASVGFLVPEFGHLPAYWIWLASIAAMTIAYVVFSGDGVMPVAKPRKGSEAPVDRGEFSPFVWVLLGATVFWIAISAVNHAASPQDTVTAAANEPLTEFVNDRAKLLTPVQASQLSFALQQFEKQTPDQIVVAIYPRAPGGSIDEFTIRTAERSRIGRGGVDTGAILSVFMEERAARLEVGYGLEGILTDVDSHRILEANLGPAFAHGTYFDGLDATLQTVFAKLQEAYKTQGSPDQVTIWKRKLADDHPNRLGRLWRTISNVGFAARVGIAFLFAFVGLILWSTIPQWGRLYRDVAQGIANVRAKRPFQQGLEAVDGTSLVDSVRLLIFSIGLLIPAAGAIIIAGGGAFGGAGALIHW